MRCILCILLPAMNQGHRGLEFVIGAELILQIQYSALVYLC